MLISIVSCKQQAKVAGQWCLTIAQQSTARHIKSNSMNTINFLMDLIIIIKFHFSVLQCSVEIHFKQCENFYFILINELYHDCSTKLEIISFHTLD